jgi:uncharacterized membrane protein SpoIIM required for sporulation
MNAAIEIATFVIAAGIAWLFWRAVKDKFERAANANDREGQRTQMLVIWAVIGVFVAGIFLAPWILYWLG